MVIHAVHLARPRRPGGSRNAEERSGIRLRNCRTTDDLPTAEGPDSTSMRPFVSRWGDGSPDAAGPPPAFIRGA